MQSVRPGAGLTGGFFFADDALYLKEGGMNSARRDRYGVQV